MTGVSSNDAERASEATIASLRAICREVGLDLDALSPFVLERMRLLAEVTKTATDGANIVRIANAVFARADDGGSGRPWSASERRIVILGSIFADIGKTGPLDADAEGQRLVAEMFAVEGVKDEAQSVETFFRAYFPGDADERIRRFRALGLDASMSMRYFWNLHTGWTFEIVEAGGVPREVIVAAATHHLLDHINPHHVVEDDGRFSEPFGENVAFDRAEKLVIVLDKYDALRRRAALTHEAAIAWLRSWVSRHERYGEDAELFAAIADVEAVGDRPPPV
mgnify:CR=1 FL=1